MSRALDKDVLVSLRDGDHAQIYRDISQALTVHAGPELLEIEILGLSHPLEPGQSVLRDENAIGVPKLRLVQAFIVARQVFQTKKISDQDGSDALRSATGVLLLMDAEHLTAANTRKRILLKAVEDKEEDSKALIDREMRFVDGLLTSRLHRHTKSPTLWSHRRWLMQLYHSANHTRDIVRDFREVIMVSGERHPRNYYAWCHARWLVRRFEDAMSQDDQKLLWEKTKKWCFSHHNDISGWSFLDHLTTRGLAGNGHDRNHAALLVFRETLKLASSFQWRNESVWWFLHLTATRMELPGKDEEEFNLIREKLVGPVDDESKAPQFSAA